MEVMYKFSILAFKECDQWVAQCLEYDLATQAESLPKLFLAVEQMVKGHFDACAAEGLEPLAHVPEAPAHFRDKWNEAIVATAAT